MSTARQTGGEALLSLDTLVLRYGALLATDQVSLAVPAGEIHALIGPNGAGKTSLINQISGILSPMSGNIYFAGQNVTALPMHARVRLGLVRSFQVTSLFGRMSVLDNLTLAVQARMGSFMRFWQPAKDEAAPRAAAIELAARVGLTDQLEQAAAAMSHGEQRRLELGLALALQPRLVLLDEPMAGMGAEESALMLELLQGLRGELAMILVEHDMDVVFRLADRISVLLAGRIVATGTPAEIHASPVVQQAYLGDMEDAVMPGAPS